MGEALRRELETRFGEQIRFDVPVARLISLRVGGPADAVVAPADRQALLELLARLAAAGVPHHVVGGGFNCLASDAPLEAVVIQLGRFRALELGSDGALTVEAGVSHSQLTRFCCEHGLAGLEFGAGIPGSFGGWVAMNAGIPGREIGDRILELEVADPDGAGLRHLPAAELDFRYRALRGLPEGSVIVSARVRVERADPAAVRAEVDALLARRAQTQPLSVPSCGSVFKNPPGDHAGRLIEQAGLKGHRVGGAQISPVHANFIANTGGASAADVLALIELAQRTVESQTGTRLEREVRWLGGESQ